MTIHLFTKYEDILKVINKILEIDFSNDYNLMDKLIQIYNIRNEKIEKLINYIKSIFDTNNGHINNIDFKIVKII